MRSDDIGKELSPFEASLLSDLPVLIGIDEVEYHTHSDSIPFGFVSDITALGFGDISNQSFGGNFAKIIT